MAEVTPQAGDILTMEDLQMVFDAVRGRQEKHPDEPAGISFFAVISQIGEQFRQVECAEQEWTGVKKDVQPGKDEPKCPNGHSLHLGSGIAIGWVAVP